MSFRLPLRRLYTPLTPLRVRVHPYSTTIPSTARPTSPPTNHPNHQRSAQLDRESIDAQPNEYAKSGTDAETASVSDAAFDPNSSNDPDEVRKEIGKEHDVNPLDASPANPELSSGTSEVSGGADKKMSEGGGGRQGGGDSTGDKSGGSSV